MSQEFSESTSKKRKMTSLKPQRNKSAFMLFSIDTRQKLKSNNQLNSNEMMIKIAELWKQLDLQERSKYEDIAKQDRERYKREFAAFAQAHPTKIIHNRTKGNYVKKPPAAYGLFVKNITKTIKENNEGIKMADVLKKVPDLWKQLSAPEKAVFEEKAKIEKKIARDKLRVISNVKQNKKSKSKTKVKQDLDDSRFPKKLKIQDKNADIKLKKLKKQDFAQQKQSDKFGHFKLTAFSSTLSTSHQPKIISIFDDKFEHAYTKLQQKIISAPKIDYLDEDNQTEHKSDSSTFQTPHVLDNEFDFLNFNLKREES